MNQICLSLVDGPKNKSQIIKFVESKIKRPYAYSTLKKDIKFLRSELLIPVVYIPITVNRGNYMIDPGSDFGRQLLLYFSDFVLFDKEVNKLIFQ